MQAIDQTQLTSADILFLSLNELGIQPSVDSFEDRLRVQKVAFVLQQCGVRLNYRYSWYLHGPYSSELTSDLYRIASQHDYFADRTQNLSFVPEIHERVNKLREILGPILNDAQLLEAIASILYIGRSWKETIRGVKPGLDQKILARAEQAIQQLVKQGLIDPDQV
jgi:uncharacterized protein YwgA